MFIDFLTLIMINLVAGTALLSFYLYKGWTAEDQRPYAAGFGIPLLLMELVNRSPFRRYYSYLFG